MGADTSTNSSAATSPTEARRRGRPAGTGAGSRRARQAGLHPVPARPAPSRGRRVRAASARRADAVLRLPPTKHSSSSTSPHKPRGPPTLEDLATLRFVEEKANCLLIGPPGVGKHTRDRARPPGGARRLPRLLHNRRGPRRPHLTRGDRRTMATRCGSGPDHRFSSSTSSATPDARRSRSHLFQVITAAYEHGQHHPHHQPRDRDWGADLQRHNRRDRRPRPPTAPRQRALRHRR